MSAKSFASSPAMQFISQQHLPDREKEAPAASSEASDGVRWIERRELKTKRVQLLLKPSVHARIKKMAEEHGVSFNDYVNRVLERETLEG